VRGVDALLGYPWGGGGGSGAIGEGVADDTRDEVLVGCGALMSSIGAFRKHHHGILSFS